MCEQKLNFTLQYLKKQKIMECEDVIHCAAALHVGAKDVKKDVVDPSVIGVQNLCSVMHGVKRIIHTSSVAAIRSTKFENGHIFTNKDWCDDASETSNAYGFAKAEAEKIMREWASNREVRLVTIHPSIVFGPILHKRHLEGSMSYLKHFVKGPPFVLDVHINFVRYQGSHIMESGDLINFKIGRASCRERV